MTSPTRQDVQLLRQYEPVLRFTQGEIFHPTSVDNYLQMCSLWLRDADGRRLQIAEVGEINAETLARYDETPPGHTLYLEFVQAPLIGLDYRKWRNDPDRPRFKSAGMLARVGLLARIIDSISDIALLLRGRVPQGTTAAADLQMRQIFEQNPHYIYYGRILRDSGYIILHYLFFYPMNDWRSSFHGVNDHEADWEQMFVYLSDTENPEPLWVAYSAHNYSGDDLRRHWHDPDLHKVDETHPVIYVGAGSHASFFLPGDYITQVELAALRGLKPVMNFLQDLWVNRLGQGGIALQTNATQVTDMHPDDVIQPIPAEETESWSNMFSVPFVDYARGDGPSIGPGQEARWTPILLTPDMGWAEHYRGLWGLDTDDPIGGERAPGGPKFHRGGAIRQSWYDPLGWAGLHKVPPPHLALDRLDTRITELQNKSTQLHDQIATQHESLRSLQLEAQALRATDYLHPIYANQQKKVNEGENALNTLYRELSETLEALNASHKYRARLQQGYAEAPRAHLKHIAQPEPPLPPGSRLVEIWAALSSGLLVIAFALSIFFEPQSWYQRLIAVVVIFVLVESTIRGQLMNLLLRYALFMAILTAFVLIVEFRTWLAFIALLAMARLLIRDNLRELRM